MGYCQSPLQFNLTHFKDAWEIIGLHPPPTHMHNHTGFTLPRAHLLIPLYETLFLGNSWPLQKTRDKGKGKEDWLTQSEVGGTSHAMTPTTSSSHTQMRTLRRMKLNFNLRLMRTLGVERSSEKIQIYKYNGGKQNWPFFKTADFSINNAINPTNLGAK